MTSVSRLAAIAMFSATLALAVVPAPVQAGQKVYSLSELDVVRKVAPEYPRQAARAGFDGWVDLEFTVSPDGDVQEAQVVSSSSRIFHREALVALQSWEFKPVMLGGAPTPVRAHLRFTFQGN